jgi:hypothetical protein
MAKPTNITDPFVQTALVEAEQALDAGDYLDCPQVRRGLQSYRSAATRDGPEAA